MEILIDIMLLVFLVVLAIGAARLANLFAAVMLFGIYSLMSAALFVSLDAVDVAFTEAAVGAGISTILMLATLGVTSSRQHPMRARAYTALAAVAIVGLVLGFAVADLPRFGDPYAPAMTHVVPRYLDHSGFEIGIPNVVTSVLASYRGYDTLGEVTVIFTAGIGVLSLLGRGRARTDRAPAVMEHHLILRVAAKMLVPMILLFALYVQFHGDFGPGGGFQAGVIFGAGFILYGLLFGVPRLQRVAPSAGLRTVAAGGVLLYAGVGLAALAAGGNFLDYGVLAEEPVAGQHLGILLIELGVGMTVAAVMTLLFYAFTEG